MSDAKDLRACSERRRRLMAETGVLAKSPRTAATRLKLLVLKRDLQEVVRCLRERQAAIGNRMSRSTAAAQAVNAYARTAQAWKNKGR